MLQALWIGAGGFLGDVLRYGLVAVVHRSSDISDVKFSRMASWLRT